MPIPTEAPPMEASFGAVLASIGSVEGIWTYSAGSGDVVGYVVCITPTGRRKDYRTVTYREYRDGTRRWAFGPIEGSHARPLYNLREIRSRPEADVLIVRGEWAVDAARMLAPAMVVTTTMHGEGGPRDSDFAPLKGRNVWIWADVGTTGAAYAETLKKHLKELDPLRQVRVLPTLTEKPGKGPEGSACLLNGARPPQGWNAADAIAEGWTAEHLRLLLNKVESTQCGISMNGRGELVHGEQPEATPNVPVDVLGVLQLCFPRGLKYFQQNFYSYQAGHWRMLDEVANVKKAVAQYYGRSAVAKEVEATTKLLSFFLAENEGFRSHPAKICMLNGTLDTDTYELVPHSPDHALINQLAVEWNPQARCSRWLQFLDDTFGPDADRAEKIVFLQQWFGYCLTPDVSQQKFTWLVGAGANGKSVILKILTELVGPSNVSAAKIGELEKGPVRAELQGKLLNISAEMSADATVADGCLKELVAGDPVSAERKYQKPFMFRPTVKFMASTNSLPRLQDLSHGFTRRAVIITFNRIVSEVEMDRELEAKLLQELGGILVWSIEGLRQLRAAGKFTVPVSSTDAVAEYRTESDPVALFVHEALRAAEAGGTTPTELFERYRAWAEVNGFGSMSIITFGKRLQGLGHRKQRGHGKDIYPLILKSQPAEEASIACHEHSEARLTRYKM